jgi:hypothetical protein
MEVPIFSIIHPPNALLFPFALIPPIVLRLTQRGHLLGEVRLAQAPEARAQHLEWWRPPECSWEGKGEACPWVARSRPQGTSCKESLLIGGHGSCSVGVPWGVQWAGVVFSHSPRPCPLSGPGRLRAHPAWSAHWVSKSPRRKKSKEEMRE